MIKFMIILCFVRVLPEAFKYAFCWVMPANYAIAYGRRVDRDHKAIVWPK